MLEKKHKHGRWRGPRLLLTTLGWGCALCCALGCEPSLTDPSSAESDGATTRVTEAGTPQRAGETGPRAAASDAGKPPARDASALPRDARVVDDAGTPVAPGTDGGGATSPGTGDPGNAADGGSPRALPPVTSVSVDGPFKTEQSLTAGPKGASGLFRPQELGAGGLRHPIFLFGCGGSSRPSQYVDHMNRIASHGFVAIAEVSVIDGNGVTLKASLDWIIAENARPDSVFYQKLDTTKIAMGGHSIGSVNTFSVASDPRLITTIHIAGGSLDNMGSEAAKLTHPAAFIASESDTFGNVEKAEADYKVTTVPVFFTIMSGVDHTAAARQGLPAVVAWLRWHLGGESERRAMFLDPKGEFSTGKFVSRNKNW